MFEWGEKVWPVLGEHWDDILVALALIGVVLLHRLGHVIGRRRREAFLTGVVSRSLDELILPLSEIGGSRVDVRWRPSAARMVVEVTFEDGSSYSVQGLIGVAVEGIVLALMEARARQSVDETEGQEADPERPVAPSSDGWWTILGVDKTANYSEIRSAYRNLAKTAHPDLGGDALEMARLNAAMDAAKSEKQVT